MRVKFSVCHNAGTFLFAVLLLFGTLCFAQASKLIGSISECDNTVLLRRKEIKSAAAKPTPKPAKQKRVKSPKGGGKGKPPVGAVKPTYIETPCMRFDLLYEGDELEVKPGGKVHFVVDKSLYKTDVPGRLVLKASSVTHSSQPEALTRTEISSGAAKLAAPGSLGFSGLGISLKTAPRHGGNVTKLSPVGAALSEKVTIKWDANQYPASRIALYSETTGRPLVDIKSPSDKLPKPGQEWFVVPMKLQTGILYSWDVNATYSGYAVFRILTSQQREELRAMLADAQTLQGLDADGALAELATARAYARYDVLDKAMEVYDALKAKGIDSPDFLKEYDKVVAEYKRYTEPEKKQTEQK